MACNHIVKKMFHKMRTRILLACLLLFMILPAKLFAELWPNHLSGEEAKNDLNFQAKMTSLDEIVDILLNAWEERYSSNQTLAPSL